MKNKNKQTRFPVARIKRIMQKDEEVGKVAQATPVVISKALEMFLATIVEEAARVTTDRGAKKVEAYHLKHAVETVETLDFLKEIVEAVPDPSAGGTIDLQAEAAEKAAAKKRSRARKPAATTEGGAPAAPRKRRKKEDGEKQTGRKAKGKDTDMDANNHEGDGEEMDQDMDQEEPEPEEEEDYPPRMVRKREEDDDDWEG
ncbi:hypothetical protein PHLGIDRAFT_31056 [Phlebiopsis gigantea 11061_1 CR5-6]|uniref:Transcription factor CBF/NF-Y/archaeal histone domain-containing protein n=1 Tax=Phlebiopsis gigantea (strain 11061_1 CR5-6) TaxID=745531 RepID=A0A0C3RV38_PHLG1|nr:hypothetical protein PHLGIDRAFT_31056 [Phlebiopsis gigantea 11061_1 CR5-6]